MNVRVVKRVRGRTIGLFLALNLLVLAAYLAVFQFSPLQVGQHSIGGSVRRTLILNTLLILGPIAGVLLWYEGLSLQDIGIA